MTDLDVVEKFGEILDLKVYSNNKVYGVSKKISYRVVVRGKKAVTLMEAIRPHMGERRRAQIDELLAFESNRPDPNDGRREWSKQAAASRERDAKGRLTSKKKAS